MKITKQCLSLSTRNWVCGFLRNQGRFKPPMLESEPQDEGEVIHGPILVQSDEELADFHRKTAKWWWSPSMLLYIEDERLKKR
ncbi:hypothetical protein C1H46_021676 [Malus baccata]|uniref:Uncharacterized protein n=1 Tax=Malus baccata TaxID=106549 RepID=A0A540M1R5_MALBA|nr:hypothetical protein C1H46_021676 [Malus baccata]